MRMARRLCGRFFCGFSSFYIAYFLPNNYYLVYLHLKFIRYGKGYPRTSAAQYRRDEAEGLVFQLHFGCIYGSDGGTGGGDEELPIARRIVRERHGMH